MTWKPSEESREGTVPSVAERATSGHEPTAKGGTDPDVPPKAGMTAHQPPESKPPTQGES